MKKLSLLLAVILCVGIFAGCASKPEELAWEGYEDMPFIKFLEVGKAAVMSDSELNQESIEISVEEGWDKAEEVVDEDDLEEGEKAYTFLVEEEVTSNSSSSKLKIKTYYFMKCKDNTLYAMGARIKFYGGGEVISDDEYTAAGAQQTLTRMRNAL